jgi:predicted alpha/beta-fold hydrolase
MERVTETAWRDDAAQIQPFAAFIPQQSLSARLQAVARAFESKPFEPYPIIRSGHAQTLLAALRLPRYAELRGEARGWESRLVEVEPGVRVLLKCRWQPERSKAPLLLLIHGLEGSTESLYVRGTARKAFHAGFNVARMNQRTCGGTEHLSPTLYHSGLSCDIRTVFQQLAKSEGLSRIFIAGYSMSGNMVLKLAGDYGDDPPRELAGVSAVSPSLDLDACAAAIEKPENRIYLWSFMRSLHRRIRRKDKLQPGIYDTSNLSRARTLREFDNCYTAPHGGYRDADDYYACTSSLPVIPRIRVPALVLHAEDDPIVPPEAFREQTLADNPNVLLLLTLHGGHTAFISRALGEEDRYWAENRVVEFCRMLTGAPLLANN